MSLDIRSVTMSLVLGWVMSAFGSGVLGDDRAYELRVYTTNPGKLDALHTRFRDHTTKLFEKHGMTNHAYWVPTDEARQSNTLIYIISHASIEAAKESWAGFRGDPVWKQVAEASEKEGKILAAAPESVFMQATDFSPNNFDSGDQPRLFELRRYTTVEGRLPQLLQRFRDGELDLFTKHGMTNVAYYVPDEIPNTLIYVVAHKDAAAMEASWAEFREDPEWKKLWRESEQDGKIVINVERHPMTVIDYSPLQ